jgi:hypothetical protein
LPEGGTVARLGIYNGNTLVREIDIASGPVRVGRSDQNDIVLIDPAKAVSRFHAELTIEDGAWTIADLNSQNGTWVAGRRVQRAGMVPGQAVLVGTYRLMLEPEAPAVAGDTQGVPGAAQLRAIAEHEPHPAEPPGTVVPLPTPAARLVPPIPAAPVAAPSLDTVLADPLPPAAPPAARPVHHEHPVAVEPEGRARRVLLVAAASVCLALAGVAGGVFWGSRGPAVSAGQSAEAPPQPVLGGPPTEPPVPAVSSAGSPPGLAPEPQPATAPRGASAVTPAVPAPTSVSARPEEPAKTSPPTARPRKATAPAPARKEPSATAKGVAEPKPREVNVAQSVDQARAAVAKGDYVTALGLLQPVMRVDAGNPEALDLLGAVRAQGHDAFRRGRQFDAVGRTPDAIAMYEKAIKLLPDDHPSAVAARERLAALR